MPNFGPAEVRDRNGEPDAQGFSSAVLPAFAFLQSTYRFDAGTAEPAVVRFRSNRLFLNVWQESRSREIGLSIGRLSHSAETTHPFNLADVIDLKDAVKATAYRDYAARTRDQVRVGVSALARDLRTYGHDALGGDDSVFDEMAARRNERIKDYAVVVDDARVRKKSRAAWARKDFVEVARLLGSVEDRLSLAERSKLEYARHQSGNSPELEP